jgi:opacity protein-like surface antigen
LKKSIFLIFIFYSVLFGFDYDAKFYVGLGGGYQVENFTKEVDAQNSPYFGSIKFGYGDIRAYAVELVLNYIDNKSNIFSPDDKQRYGLDVMFLKSLNISKYFYPYARVGLGAGEMKVDRKTEDKLGYSSFNAGFGVFVPVFNHIDLEANYEYRFTSYESVDLIDHKVKLQSHVNQFYIGINTRF